MTSCLIGSHRKKLALRSSSTRFPHSIRISVSTLQQTLWDAADEVLLVSTPDKLSVLDAYAATKQNCSREQTPLGLLVNRAMDEEQARDVHRRLGGSSRRFLKTDIAWRGWLPYSDALATARNEQQSALRPSDRAGRVMETLVEDYRAAKRQRPPAY